MTVFEEKLVLGVLMLRGRKTSATFAAQIARINLSQRQRAYRGILNQESN